MECCPKPHIKVAVIGHDAGPDLVKLFEPACPGLSSVNIGLLSGLIAWWLARRPVEGMFGTAMKRGNLWGGVKHIYEGNGNACISI